MDAMDTSDTNGHMTMPKPPLKKIPPPPPSIGSSSGDSSSKKAPPAPSMTASKRGPSGADSSSSVTKKVRRDLENSGIPSLTQEQKRLLANDQSRINWLFGRGPSMDLTYDSLALGRVQGPVEPELYVDTTFCKAQVLQQLMDIKYEIMEVSKEKFFDARNKMSTYDKIFGKDGLFHNSDAIKMANIDAVLDFQLSNPRNTRNEPLVGANELLYFADICGGPGGFAEYILWKKQWNAKGFGFTAKTNDWDLPLKPHYPKECFEAMYGFFDRRGAGDIQNPDELKWFRNRVRRIAHPGVHVAVALGGDSSEGDEDKKELRCKYMLLAEVICALSIIREGGHFVMRTYDMFTPFTAGLIFLLHQLFETIAVHKPETVMYASAERFVFCKGKKVNRFTQEVINYLLDCQNFFKKTNRMYKNENQQAADIQELVPTHIIRSNQRFMEFIMDANEKYGQQQLQETRKLGQGLMHSGAQNPIRGRLSMVEKKATTLWGLPKTFTQLAKYSDVGTPDIRAAKLVAPYPPDTFSRIEREGEQELTFQTMEDELLSPSEWHFFMVGRDRGFFLSLGEDEVYRFGGAKWSKIQDKIELAANTLVYGDIVDEIEFHEARQVTTPGFQIIDALVLGGTDVRHLPHVERLELCTKFGKAMDKSSRQDLAAVRAKTPYQLLQIHHALKRIQAQRLKGGGRGPSKEATYPIDGIRRTDNDKSELLFKPSGALLVKTSKQNSIPGDFLFAMQNRLIWRWSENVSLELDNPEALEDMKEKHGPIHAVTFIEFLKQKK